ncbi:HAMP domain-containing protein [Parahaliea maris]|uniref:histidine kinase n=1 Tax=Parahaliea maris TaxID=2716870 RepID=A0A5C9AA93_9GAMM|nr:ATP-binding protein [Parahaliea maris]TXS96211.1 HAMP domain-containing protein [Parahaliea maris]
MSLRRQLIVISLLLLALPWAGCQFLRETENTLRQGQAIALQATAQAVAASFSEQPGLLYPDTARLREPAELNGSIYARAAQAPIIVDGYADGWPDEWSGGFGNHSENGSADQGPGAAPGFRYQAATRNGMLYLLLAVSDNKVVYDNPGLSPEPNGDRLLIRTWLDGRRQDYAIATAAPGAVRARAAGRRHPGVNPGQITGVWQDTQQGYTLEIQLPLGITGNRLGLQIVDVDGRGAPLTAGNFTPLEQQAPPWLIYYPDALQQPLSAFGAPGRELAVFDINSWQLAQVAPATPPDDTDANQDNRPFWLLRWLYRRILSQQEVPPLPQTTATGRLAAAELVTALRGQDAIRWYRETTNGRRSTLSAAAPIRSDGEVIGAVLLRQGSEEYLALTDRAFSKLLSYSLLAAALAALGLLGYASVLSWRIGRLSRAAGRVAQRGNIVTEAFPRSKARDEVGELSRRFADLLEELRAYNEYLQTLSRKLSHELRTPIAVIQSSLDNLDEETAPAQRDVFVARAREGLERLGRILTAMTEASRVEESVRSDVLAELDLVPLLKQVVPAYQSAYPGYRLQLKCDLLAAPCLASPDLLVQALDKLVDNAASFSAPGGPIQVSLTASGSHWELAVTNQGPPLPEHMQGQLFEAMVSLREKSAGDGVHLGLGLYIVKLITETLGGQVQAHNLPGAEGVMIALRLPRGEL